MIDWVTLKPKLTAGGVFAHVVHEAVQALGSANPSNPDSTEYIRKIRTASLAAITKDESDESYIARVCIAVFSDLRLQGWEFQVEDKAIRARKPLPRAEAVQEEKERIRAGLVVERDQQLRTPAVREFIQRMEQRRQGPNGWVSIYDLMRDGYTLAKYLQRVALLPAGQQRITAINAVIEPYIQLVDDSSCEHTGFALKDIWRYFRFTWSNSSRTVPGRNIWFLVRDRAARNHPVIGIAALGSAVVQLTVRDGWIGWNGDEFLDSMAKDLSDDSAVWLEQRLARLVSEVYIDDFVEEHALAHSDLVTPTLQAIENLLKISSEAKEQHHRFAKNWRHKTSAMTDDKWEAEAHSPLFRAKRAGTLAALLDVKLRLLRSGFHEATRHNLLTVLKSLDGRSAAREVMRRVKATHVGIDMMDITVCGAVQPYNAILGGKLVSLLMASPEVGKAYEERYTDVASVIASSMAGRPVRRRPRLVLLGTTSLYGVGSSQYNRIRMPAEEAGGAVGEEVRYHELGQTLGFGTFHFSNETVAEFEVLWAKTHDARVVNSIFGEGVNPRLRKIRDGLDMAGLSSEYILKHGNRRIVYGVPLARNFRAVLQGRDDEPEMILPTSAPKDVTQQMAGFWIRRWLAPRIENTAVIEKVAKHTLIYPVTHGARVQLPDVEPDIENDEFSDLPLFDTLTADATGDDDL